jgi:hypothetical protein
MCGGYKVEEANRIIFLDIDGCLNSEAWWNNPHVRSLPFYERSFDPRAVARLNRLIAEADAGIVLSSSWRTNRRSDAEALFRLAGIKGEAVGVTPWLLKDRHATRGDEIRAYLARQFRGPDALVILDDGSDMGHLLPHLVQVDHRVGLQDADVKRALAMLASPALARR